MDETYPVTMTCENCLKPQQLDVPKGVPVSEHTEDLVCSYCEVRSNWGEKKHTGDWASIGRPRCREA